MYPIHTAVVLAFWKPLVILSRMILWSVRLLMVITLNAALAISASAAIPRPAPDLLELRRQLTPLNTSAVPLFDAAVRGDLEQIKALIKA